MSEEMAMRLQSPLAKKRKCHCANMDEIVALNGKSKAEEGGTGGGNAKCLMAPS